MKDTEKIIISCIEDADYEEVVRRLDLTTYPDEERSVSIQKSFNTDSTTNEVETATDFKYLTSVVMVIN